MISLIVIKILLKLFTQLVQSFCWKKGWNWISVIAI